LGRTSIDNATSTEQGCSSSSSGRVVLDVGEVKYLKLVMFYFLLFTVPF